MARITASRMRRRLRNIGTALVALAFCALPAWSLDVPLPGTKLTAKKKLVWLVKDELPVVPTGLADPTIQDALLWVYNPDTLEAQAIELPVAGWTANDAGTKLKFKGKKLGSVAKVVSVREKKGIKVVLKDTAISLDESAQGSLGIELSFDGRQLRYCSRFGDNIQKDKPGKFIARNVGPPASCPVLPLCGNGVVDAGEQCEGSGDCAADQACTRCQCTGTGDVSVTLLWDGEADLDLHVTGPSGEEIYWENPRSASGGRLDVDANPTCRDPTVTPVENVFWVAGTAPPGRYTVRVRLFSGCGTTPPIPFTVVTDVDGVRSEFAGTAMVNVKDESCGRCGECTCVDVTQFTR